MTLSRPLAAFAALTLAIAGTLCAAPAPNFSAGTLSPAASMLAPRSGQTATLLPNGKVLIAGGMRRNQDFYKSAELFDPTTGTFQPTGEMHEARVGHIAVLLRSGKVLVAGGWVGGGGTDAAEVYDPGTGKFSVIAKMTAPRGKPSATVLPDGDVLIAGGEKSDNQSVASAEIFHLKSLSFTATSSMHHARVSHTATLLNDGRVLIVGGYAETILSSAEVYDPKTTKFTETETLSGPRCKHTAGLLSDGRVLIAGGSTSRGWDKSLNSAEIFDPHAGKFAPMAALNDARFKLPDEAVQLPSGRLLIAGGSREVEVYDPATGRFEVASGQMNAPWHYLTATKLNDGRVLLAGGYANNAEGSALTWIYKP
jgi:hypothetical protein